MAQTACSCTTTSPASRATRTRVISVSRAAPRGARHHTSLPRRQAPRRCLGGVLVSSALLSYRLLRILLLAMCLSLLPQQAACCTSTRSNSAPAGVHRFPQPVWTTRGCVRWRVPGDSRRGVPRQQRGATSRWLREVAAGCGSRTSGHSGWPVCAAARGLVSAATLKGTLRGWTAPASRWAARPHSGPPSARQRARTAAAPCLTSPPPEGRSGRHRRRCTPPVSSLSLVPTPPHGGSAARWRSWRSRWLRHPANSWERGGAGVPP